MTWKKLLITQLQRMILDISVDGLIRLDGSRRRKKLLKSIRIIKNRNLIKSQMEAFLITGDSYNKALYRAPICR